MKQLILPPHREHPLHQMLHLFLQKAVRFPTEQRDQVEEEWHVLPFTMLIYVSLFELQREV